MLGTKDETIGTFLCKMIKQININNEMGQKRTLKGAGKTHSSKGPVRGMQNNQNCEAFKTSLPLPRTEEDGRSM